MVRMKPQSKQNRVFMDGNQFVPIISLSCKAARSIGIQSNPDAVPAIRIVGVKSLSRELENRFVNRTGAIAISQMAAERFRKVIFQFDGVVLCVLPEKSVELVVRNIGRRRIAMRRACGG